VLAAVLIASSGIFVVDFSAVSAQTTKLQRGQVGLVTQVQRGRFVGEVIALFGPAANPTGLTVQLGLSTADVHFGTQYTPHPLSAEAEVEGIAVHDFVSMVVRKGQGEWVAQRVDFDVQPFGRLRLVTAAIVNLGPEARHLRIRLADTGQVRWVTLSRQTMYESDGKPLTVLPLLLRDQAVQILVIRGDLGWVAATINLKSAGG
jgi:hypothetical protein